jgi:hypothetical protein
MADCSCKVRGLIEMPKLAKQVLILLFLGFAMLAAFSAPAAAQNTHGYAFVAPGAIGGLTTIHLGGGAEFALPSRIGAGLELGALGPAVSFEDVLAVLSLNGYYHFAPSTDRFDPFVTAGYSMFFRTRTASLFNFGGGVNYWFLPRVGFKSEFRDHVRDSPGPSHYWGLRFGLTFR